MALEQPDPYPVRFSMDYPESSRRLTTFFRLLLGIPILIVLGLISGAPLSDDVTDSQWTTPLIAGGLLWIPTLLMILFRRKYPRWWFDWNLELTRFVTRVYAYLMLLQDDYPSTDEQQGVHLDIPYPDAEGQLNRFLPLFKWILAIPHYIALAVAATIIALVRDPDRRSLPEGAVPVRGGGLPLGIEGGGLCVSADYRPLPAVPVRRGFVRLGPSPERPAPW